MRAGTGYENFRILFFLFHLLSPPRLQLTSPLRIKNIRWFSSVAEHWSCKPGVPRSILGISFSFLRFGAAAEAGPPSRRAPPEERRAAVAAAAFGAGGGALSPLLCPPALPALPPLLLDAVPSCTLSEKQCALRCGEGEEGACFCFGRGGGLRWVREREREKERKRKKAPLLLLRFFEKK